MLRKLATSILVACTLAGCQDKPATAGIRPDMAQTKQEVKTMTQQVSIKIGEQGKDWLSRYSALVKSYKPTPNVTSFAADWNEKPRGIVKIDHGKHSFEIDDVLSISSMQVAVHDGEGLFQYSVNAGITAPDLIAHDEARDKLYAILKAIEQKGWKVVTPRGDPRIKGTDRFSYVLKKDKYIGLDTSYVPSLDEWMNLENLSSWNFYVDRQYLTVQFKRERTLLDPTKPGSYLLTYTLKSEAEHFRAYVGPDNRARWKELLPAELVPRDGDRAKAEATLKAQGITIDETYQDPPLPDLK
jgi:hypothetical protein